MSGMQGLPIILRPPRYQHMASSLSLKKKVLLTDVDQSSIGEEDLQLVEYDEARVRDIAKDVIRAEVRNLETQAKH
jgi:hypothetical protein